MSARSELIEVIRENGLIELDAPVELASGDWSRHFIDVKRALATGRACALAGQSMIELADSQGIEFDSVGGLTMGADVLAHGVAMLRPDVKWFSVRKAAKDRGTRRRIEGAELGAGDRVLLVDDVVTRAGSIIDALEAVRLTGAVVVAAVPLVDRGPFGAPLFREESVPYLPLMTYHDLGIPPVGSESGVAEATA
jgi:orotate phosphoribosyltransferase